MVSRNNQWQHLQASARRVPHYGLRKLSIGVASVLLSTTLYMGVSAHADTVVTPGETTTTAATVTTPNSGAAGTTGQATGSDVNAKPNSGVTETTGQATGSGVNVKPNLGVAEMTGNAAGSGANGTPATPVSEVPTGQVAPDNTGVTPERAADGATDSKAGIETPTQPATSVSSTSESALPKKLVATVIKPAANAKGTETTKLATFTWTIHYVDENGNKLAPDTVISHDYQRTDTNGTMGDYKYIDGSLKVTGTHNTGYHIDVPDFKYNVPVGKTSFDIASWNVAALSFTGYRPDYGSVVLSDQLTKDPLSLGSTSHDYSGGEFTFHYTLNPKTVTINYVNDDDNEKVVGTGTVSGKPNTEVTITPSLPSGYMLTSGKDVPSKYAVTDGDNQVVTIHVQKQFIDVSDTDPQAKQTRTITLHYVYGGGPKDGQKAFDDAVLDVYYHRTATLDRVTNQTTYGDWTWDRSQGDPSTPGYHVVSGKWTNLPQSWATVTADLPSIKGYSVDLGQNDPANTNHVPANTWVFPTYNNGAGGGISTAGKGATAYLDGYGYKVSPTHTIKYVLNKTTVTVNYVDDDNNKAVVGSQHWDGTIGQHINLTLTPPANYVLTPGWVNPTSYDFDGVNSSWYTVHVKHKTQDVTDQEPKDQVTKVTRLTRNHLYGDGPHKGEKFAEPDIFDLAWKRTATKDLVTGKVNFGDWQVDRDNSKSVQGSLHLYPDNRVGDGLHSRQNGYSYIGQNSHGEFVASDGTIAPDYNTVYGWSPAEAQKYSTVNYYYGPEQVKIPVVYVDADTGQEVASKTGDDALTGDDFRDGNTVTIDQSKLTSLPTTLTGYQLLPGQTLPTSYKIDTVAGVKAINVQVVKDRSVKVTFVDDDNKGVVVGTPTIITGHTGGDPVALDLTVPDKYELADGQQLPTSYTFTKGSGDLIIHLVHQERSVTVRFIDDRFGQFTDGHYLARQVGQAITLTGRAGDTVDLNLTVPDKYQLADGQQLPTSYTFTKGSGDLTIHLVHKIAQREAIIDVRLGLLTEVHVDNNSDDIDVIPKTKWTPQLADEPKTADIDDLEYKLRLSSSVEAVEAGTLTGHVNYDLVDEKVVSFGDDWTTLNLNGQTYQMPNGTDVVNGVIPDYNNYTSENFREGILKSYPILDPDYANRAWHGYLSVNATNNNDLIDGVHQLGLQAGLAGDEPNALAKATGDRAAISVEIGNKTIDLSFLQSIINPETVDFSEQNGQLRADEFLPVGGVYIPYVEKTATRTIEITMPDGKTTTVKQTVTLAKQVVLEYDAHQNWTAGEWARYDVPTIPGYTASQPNVAQQTVTGETEDQTVNITYTANPQTTTVVYQTEDGTPVHTTTVDGKTGQTVKVPNEVPAGWHIVNGKVPSELTFGPDGAPKTVVTIDHSHVTVTPDTPKTPADKLPDNPDKAYPAGVSENDLNKTVTRTIKVTTPDGQTKTIAQTAKLTRTADVDEVTGEVTYGKWLPGEWDAYEVPTVDGYTATQTSVAATPVDEHTADQMVEVSYSPNKQTITVKYVDDKGQTIHTTTVDGATDQTVKVPSEVPAGWMVTKGKVPSEITFGADGHEPIEVTVAHQHVTVTSDHPQTNGTKLPDNPVKTFNGVETSDLNKTITRTIKVTTPDGKTATTKQEVKLTRTADVDEVTGEVTYSKWTTGQWNAYEVPVLNGYTASQASVEATPVDENTKNQTVEVSYTPNKQSTTIKYVDDKGDVVHTTTVTGVTDQTVKVPLETPAGWTITKGKVPSEITFGADGHEPVVITVAHQHVTVDPDHPQTNGTKLPDNPAKTFNGVEANDLNKTITRTIKVTTPDGQTKTVSQAAKLTRTADVDEVTGEVTYSKWTTGQWAAYEVPALNGYTVSQTSVEATSVDENTKDQTVEVSYMPNKQTTTIKYVDDKGDVVHTTTVNGVTNQTVKVPSEVPAGWTITKGKVPSEITFGVDGHEPVVITVGHQHVTVDPDHPQTNGTKLPDNPAKTFEGVEANDLNKIITRTIKVTTPDGKATTTKQTAKLTRTADVDEVTGEVTYGKWTTGEWDAYEVPALNGYTASQASVEATPVDENTKDQTVEVSYTPNKQSTTIKYVDDKGDVVHTTTVTGVTDQTVKVPDEVPAGWTITKGEVPSEITFGPNGTPQIVVTIVHQHVTVDPDHLQNNGTKLPDNPAKTFEGVEANDLNKIITRTIKVTTPDGQTKTVSQTAKLTRTADVDEVTGKVTYGKWTTGEWNTYEVPALNGYTASQTSVETAPVDENTKDQTVEVSYTPNKQSTTVKYVDDKGQVVHTTTVDGVTNQTVKVPSEVPAGWTITKGKVPSEITFGVDGHEPVVITVGHQHVTVDPDHPQTNGTKLPDNPAKTFEGVEANDLNKIITRTIKVTTPDGKVTTTKQTAKLTRTADVDEVTGEVTYGKWTTGQWNAYEVPALNGYTASQNEVPATEVTSNTTDQMIDVYYTANSQTTHINYIDDAGKIVHTTTVTGKTDQTVKVPNEVPAGWMITKGEVPSEISFGPNGHADETITIGHQHVTVDPDHPQNNGTKLPDNPAKTFNGVEANDLNKIITRTIKVTTPDGQTKTVAQTVKLTRTADVDEVTGEVTYGKWTTGEWAVYDAPSVAGYTPSQTTVAKESVTSASKDTTVEITYSPMQHQISVEYVDDDDNGKIVKTDQVSGKTDQTITVTPSAPANYDLVDNGNRIYTVTSDGSQAVQIHVKHHQVTTSESKTVTRTINVHTPHDGTKVVKQNAELTRDVTTDQVTGNKTYGDWTTGQWKAYTPEAIPGYTPSTNEVPNSNVDGDSKNQMVDVTYTADAQKVEIVYVDDTKGGAVVKTDQVAGKTDETVKVTSDVPAGYELVGKVPSDYTMTADGHQTITVHLVHQMKTASESKTVTRTINVHTPHDGVKTIKQTAELTRNVTTDQVTDNKTYGDWSTTEWDRYAVPAVAGYVPSIEQVAQQVVNGTTADQTIDVTYSSGEHTAHINYVDGAGNIVHTTTITGRTDGTVQVPNETPAGWTVVGEPVPTKLVFGPDGHADVTVTVTHQHVTVTPDQPKTPTDKLPDNPAKTYPNGVGYDDLNKTVTRTIKVTTPDGQIKTVEQTAKLTRTADVDEVTGEVTYGAWSTGSWDAYQVPVVPGYMSSQSEVSATKVTDDTKDQTVTVTYTANDQTTHINYVDGNGKTVHTTTITGQTDQTVKVPNEVPAGWTITDGQVPSEVTFGANGHSDVTVTVDHQHVTVTPDRPQTDGTKLPGNPSQTFHGVAEADLNKVVTRTIEVAAPARKTTTVKQTAKLTRTADVDEVTGEVTYGAWSAGNWDVYQVPVVPGYMPSQSEVPAAKVTDDTKDQTVTITYTANDQTTHVNYVDGNGKIVHTTTITGKTGQTVKVPNEVSTGWKITSGQVPNEITFGADGHAPITVAVVHQHVTVTPDQPRENGTKLPDNDQLTFNGVGENDLNKVVTRTIEVTTPAGKTDTITQTVKLTRTATVDEVTGEVTYVTWSTGTWDAYQVPALKGYTASQTTVAATSVTSDTSSQTVKITYTADQGTVYVTYVDEAGHSIHTTTVTGTTGQTVKVPKEVPAGWVIIKGDVPTTVTVNGDETQTITITVQHRTVTVEPNQPQPNGTPLPDNPSQHFTGVESGDLNKTITRTIIFNVPGQDSRTITQTAKVTRTATVDEVTGEVTYGDWTTVQWPAVTVGPKTDNQTVTVDYRAVEVPTTPTTTPAARPMVTSHTSGVKSTVTPATHTKVAPSATETPAAKASQLPQTGADETANAVMTSLGLLMGALSAFALGRKKKNKGRKA